MTRLFTAVLASSLMAAADLPLAAADLPIRPVQAPDSPVRLDNLRIFSSDNAPPVLLYAATNLTEDDLDQFTVMVFVFDQDGRLKARQVAPGRRTLNAKETKYSAMVLDVGPITPTDSLMAGVDQAQRVDSEEWWRADLRALAEQAVTPAPR
jgi:hypothetical protein